uniref:Uncharacterized protein n=1 Tax=Avena sativa TaxID=4498 RepID=A0ACD5TEL0_AVESA
MAALLAKCLVISLSAVLLSLLSAGGASARGLPPPQATVNFSIAVQGMVWCKSCKYSGYYAPMDASPLQGAAVELRCRHGPHRMKLVPGVTWAGGYFLIESAQMASFTIDECKVYATAANSPACGVPMPGEPGAGKGLPLKFERFEKRGDGLQALYSAGNFFFQPMHANKCY